MEPAWEDTAQDGQLTVTDHGDTGGWLFTRCGVSYSELSALSEICSTTFAAAWASYSSGAL